MGLLVAGACYSDRLLTSHRAVARGLFGETPLHVSRRLRHATGQLVWLERMFGG
jgi:hypothetical protein